MAQQHEHEKGNRSEMSGGDPRMEDQTTIGRGESGRGDPDQAGRSHASPTSSGSFAQSEGINRGGAKESTSSGRWSNESDVSERMSGGESLGESSSSSSSRTGSSGTRAESAGRSQREEHRKAS